MHNASSQARASSHVACSTLLGHCTSRPLSHEHAVHGFTLAEEIKGHKSDDQNLCSRDGYVDPDTKRLPIGCRSERSVYLLQLDQGKRLGPNSIQQKTCFAHQDQAYGPNHKPCR
jgi:hypothetical protein